MLFLLMTWLLLGLVWLLIGLGLLNRLRPETSPPIAQVFVYAAMLGMGLTGLGWYALALLMPLSIGAAGLMLIVLAVMSRSSWWSVFAALRRLGQDWRIVGLYGAIAIAVALFMVQPVTAYDTGHYHHTVISWLTQFGAVPGLALIHYTFGYSSAWLALSAPLHTIAPDRADTVISGFAILMLVYQALPGLKRIHQAQGNLLDWFWLLSVLLCLGVFAVFGLPISPSPDVGVICFALFALSLLVQQVASTPNSGDRLPVAFAVAAYSCKATALPLLGVAGLWYIIRHRHDLRHLFYFISLTSLALSPLFLFGWRTSGCPIFPATIGCLHQLPWAYDPERVRWVAKIIRDCARWLCPPEPPEAYGLLDWLLPWLGQQKQAVFLFLVNWLVVGGTMLKRPFFLNVRYWPLWLLTASGSLLVLLRSPSIRFGVIYLLILPTLWIAQLAAQQSPWRFLGLWLVALTVNLWLGVSATLGILLTGLVLLSLLVWRYSSRLPPLGFVSLLVTLTTAITLRTSWATHPYQMAWLLPPAIAPTHDVAIVSRTVNDIVYFTPDPDYRWERVEGVLMLEDRCWNAPLPCTVQLTYDNIRLRVPAQGIRGGFVLQQPSE
ncbi:MAG: LIC_10190 family membrane protein [Spirulinaceae cyanobacterium]